MERNLFLAYIIISKKKYIQIQVILTINIKTDYNY